MQENRFYRSLPFSLADNAAHEELSSKGGRKSSCLFVESFHS